MPSFAWRTPTTFTPPLGTLGPSHSFSFSIGCRQTDGSILQPIIADRNPGTDLDIDSFIRAACVQPCHPTGDGRAAHAQLSRHLFPPRTNQSRLGINPLPKILQYPPSEFKRNLRRTPPWIPCRTMWFRHIFTFLKLNAPIPYRRRPRRLALTRLPTSPKSTQDPFVSLQRPSRLAFRSVE